MGIPTEIIGKKYRLESLPCRLLRANLFYIMSKLITMGKYYQKQENGSYQEFDNWLQACLTSCLAKIFAWAVIIIAFIIFINKCT